MKRFKTIGVLGGIGPVATAHFYQKMLSIAQEKYHAVQDYEYPHVIINSLSSTSTSEKGFENEQSDALRKELIDGIKSLEKVGAEVIVIPCNSVHTFINDLRNSTSLPIVSIIEEVVKRVKVDKVQKIGVFSSEISSASCLYTSFFEKERIDYHIHKKNVHKIVTSLILDVMGGKTQTKNKKKLLDVIHKLHLDKKVDGVILGCTELSVAICKDEVSTKLYDSLTVLAEAALSYSYNKPKRTEKMTLKDYSFS